MSYFFLPSLTWPYISSGKFGVRFIEKGSLYDSGGPALFNLEDTFLVAAFLNSKVVKEMLNVLAPTINYQINDIACLPSPKATINYEDLVKTALSISKEDWNSRETSWDFQQNGLIKQHINLLQGSSDVYRNYWSEKFYELHRNEEELNRQFIEIYGLQEELTPDVPLEEITILQEEAKIVDNQLEIQVLPVLLQLISYATGCLFGRYSLDRMGLILANQGETLQDYLQKVFGQDLHAPDEMKGVFLPDDDNIVPVLDGEWFTDDIVGRFGEFIKVAFGEEHLHENLRFIEGVLSKDIRKYFVRDFYNDHVKRYKKRPIYWMFSSPKGHFKALVYMHRYQPDLCSRILNDYLLAFISKLESAKNTQTMFSLREDITGREKTLASKEIERLEEMLKDCRKYESALFTIATQKISIDLDDGVKVNYQKFKEVLVPIKGLEKEED